MLEKRKVLRRGPERNRFDSRFMIYCEAPRLYIACCDGMSLPSQQYGLGPVVLSLDDSDVDQWVDEIG
jgi:hypothetical protein